MFCFVVLLSLVAFTQASIAGETFYQYKCDFFGCPSGVTCDSGTLDCQCPTNQYYHHAYTSCKTAGNCVDQTKCHKDGTVTTGGARQCFSSGSAGYVNCICKEGWFGNDCGVQRIDVTCNSNDMFISLFNYKRVDGAAFAGKVTFSSDASFSTATSCTATNTGNSFSVSVSYTTATATCPIATQETVSSVIYKVYFVKIAQSATVQTSADQKYKIMCRPGGESTLSLSTPPKVLDDTTTPLDSTTNVIDSVTMTLKKVASNGNLVDITGDLTIGDPIALELTYITPTTEAFIIKSCVARDQAASSGATSVNLISNSCVTADALPLFRSKVAHTETTAPPANVFTLPLKTFKFPSSSNLYFECTVCGDKGCAGSTAPSCVSPYDTYSADIATEYAQLPNALTRRKRDTSPILNTTTVAVNVVIGTGLTKSLNNCLNKEEQSCYSSMSVILPLIILSVLLLAAMIMAFFFCAKLTNKLEKHDDSVTYKS